MSRFTVRKLVPDDLVFAQRLREIAGWNQTLTDWKRLVGHEPDGCFVCDLDGKPAGTATTTCHGNDVGWIGMVLVDPEFRRQGVATRLLEECIRYLESRVRCIKLDATPAGMKVYTQLGFVEEWRLHRWRGDSAKDADTEPGEIPLDEEWLRELDRNAFGGDRTEYLQRLAVDSVTRMIEGTGFGMRRPGEHAHYLGPIVAASSDAGRALVSSLLPRSGSVIWDIPDDNQKAVELAEELGFTKERLLIRMRLGPPGLPDDPRLQWAIGAPETG